MCKLVSVTAVRTSSKMTFSSKMPNGFPTTHQRNLISLLTSSKMTHSMSRISSAPLYSMDRRISVVMICV